MDLLNANKQSIENIILGIQAAIKGFFMFLLLHRSKHH